jgi:hypothetical protein
LPLLLILAAPEDNRPGLAPGLFCWGGVLLFVADGYPSASGLSRWLPEADDRSVHPPTPFIDRSLARTDKLAIATIVKLERSKA